VARSPHHLHLPTLNRLSLSGGGIIFIILTAIVTSFSPSFLEPDYHPYELFTKLFAT
jgi:hypothetical protein